MIVVIFGYFPLDCFMGSRSWVQAHGFEFMVSMRTDNCDSKSGSFQTWNSLTSPGYPFFWPSIIIGSYNYRIMNLGRKSGHKSEIVRNAEFWKIRIKKTTPNQEAEFGVEVTVRSIIFELTRIRY